MEPPRVGQCVRCVGGLPSPSNLDLSEKCCTCYDCGKLLSQTERVPYAVGTSSLLYHSECEQRLRERRKAEALEHAELVLDYDGPVYFDGLTGSYGEGYFENVGELADRLHGVHEKPEFVFCCQRTTFSIDLDKILESACEDMHEDASDGLIGIEALRAAVHIFNEQNSSVVSFYEDRSRKVAVPNTQDVPPIRGERLC